MLLKVCGVFGASAPSEIAMLAAAGVELIGLWHGVPDGEAELCAEEFERLAGVVLATEAAQPVLVTLDGDARRLARVALRSGVRWIQLHGYQLPATVSALREAAPPGLTIIKALHVREGRALDAHLAHLYERAGVDAFVIDTATSDGRIGSTGLAIAPAVAVAVAERLERPFLLAGGIGAHNRAIYEQVVSQRQFLGVDVSTCARDTTGRLRPESVAAIRRAWRRDETTEPLQVALNLSHTGPLDAGGH
jgi:phosphoribosylanthranilate isomerase